MKLEEIAYAELKSEILIESLINKLPPQAQKALSGISGVAKKALAATFLASALMSAPSLASEQDLQLAKALMSLADQVQNMSDDQWINVSSKDFDDEESFIDAMYRQKVRINAVMNGYESSDVPSSISRKLADTVVNDQDQAANLMRQMAQGLVKKHKQEQEIEQLMQQASSDEEREKIEDEAESRVGKVARGFFRGLGRVAQEYAEQRAEERRRNGGFTDAEMRVKAELDREQLRYYRDQNDRRFLPID